MSTVNRRRFMTTSAAAMGTLSALNVTGAADQPNEKIVVAVMGVRNRGKDHIGLFSGMKDAEVACICEIDENVVPAARKVLAGRQRREVRVEKDIRRVLDDKNIDAVAIAAPDHWHALATVWACQAGKHVYVEKPISHNLIEGRRMVQAARRHNRVVQVGTQRRSAPDCQSALELVRSGKLGKIPFAKAWIAGHRPSIGHRKDGPVPKGVDYDLWQGPAPSRPFNPNRFHYEWHWFWDYGTGELGNNGIHGLDLARWLLSLDAPVRVSAGGGNYFYDDDRQTPDTQVVTFDFPTCSMVWEHRIWSRTGNEGQGFGVTLYGEHGTLIFDNHGWHVKDGITASDKSGEMQRAHVRNFLDSIKNGRRPNADIEEGHKSTRLCHLGNIAFRTGRVLRFDGKTETCGNDAEANRFLGRTYRKPFVVPEQV
jgi:predicted dehydrogenase